MLTALRVSRHLSAIGLRPVVDAIDDSEGTVVLWIGGLVYPVYTLWQATEVAVRAVLEMEDPR